MATSVAANGSGGGSGAGFVQPTTVHLASACVQPTTVHVASALAQPTTVHPASAMVGVQDRSDNAVTPRAWQSVIDGMMHFLRPPRLL